MKKTVATKHAEFVAARRRHEALEAIAHIANWRKGLNAEQVRQALGKVDLEVHAEQIGDTPGFTSVFPAGTERGPSVVAVRKLDDILDEAATQRDMGRSNKLAALDERPAPAGFDGSAIAEDAATRQLRVVRNGLLDDQRAIRGVSDYGLPIPRPPSPTANGKVSQDHLLRHAQEVEELNQIIDLEAARLRSFRSERIAAAVTRAPEYARENLQHVLKELPAQQRAAVEQALVNPDAAQKTYLISRPIVGADGSHTLGFGVRGYTEAGRPTAEGLARDFGAADARGIRVQSVAEVMAVARERVTELAVYGAGVCSHFKEFKNGLFAAPEPVE